MSNKIDRKFKHLKKRSIIPSILLFLISIIVGVLLITTAVLIVIQYIVGSGYKVAHHDLENIKVFADTAIESGKTYEEIVDEASDKYANVKSLAIVNDTEEVLGSFGDEFDSSKREILQNGFNIRLFLDSEESYKKIDKNTVYISIKDIARELILFGVENGAYPGANQTNADGTVKTPEDVLNTIQKPVYSFTYWVEDTLSDGNHIYVQYLQNITVSDCIGLLVFVCFAVVILIIILFANLVRTISNIVSSRYMLKLLLGDPVTGGNNFLAYTRNSVKYLCSFFYKKKEFALVDISLQKYSQYCTLYGTECGELLLAATDRVLSRGLKSGETSGRVANGDFILLINTNSDENAEKLLLERVTQIVNNTTSLLEDENRRANTRLEGLVNIKFKAGVYFIPAFNSENKLEKRNKNDIDIDQLYLKASMAKKEITEDSGVNVYNHDMWEKEIWEQKVQDKMEDALKAEEFQVYIQPKYHPSTEVLSGGEALVRWISPTEGFISPGKFIPIFEKTGFITKLDDYMITHTAELQAKWLKEGKKIVPISVNVSRAHFAQPDLAEHIRDLVDTCDLPHKYIEIELTESAFFDDKNALLTTVRKLQEYGFEVSMDDFGAGYSSLNSLKDLPLNVLKLDAEFFRGEDFDERGEIVVSEAISLAKQLNMRIVAEGVEKKEQVDFLASKECDMIQGFYFAKPMPANEYEERM